MSRKSLLIKSVLFIVLANGVILGGLYAAGVIWQPSAEELEAVRLAEEKAKEEIEQAKKYAHLEPLPEFKSRVNYVSSMGEAISICESTLHEKESARKSWAINYIESRYLPEKEIYMIFLDYETIVPFGEEPKIIKVTCEVEEATKLVANWMAMKSKK